MIVIRSFSGAARDWSTACHVRYRVQLTGQGADGMPIKVKPENVFLDAMAYGIPSST